MSRAIRREGLCANKDQNNVAETCAAKKHMNSVAEAGAESSARTFTAKHHQVKAKLNLCGAVVAWAIFRGCLSHLYTSKHSKSHVKPPKLLRMQNHSKKTKFWILRLDKSKQMPFAIFKKINHRPFISGYIWPGTPGSSNLNSVPGSVHGTKS